MKIRAVVFVLFLATCASGAFAFDAGRQVIDLSGEWSILADEQDRGLTEDWFIPDQFWSKNSQAIQVPHAWETVLGTSFDTVAWYGKIALIPDIPEGGKALLRFHGAATDARVWVNGQEAGRHVGAWTPFTFEIIDSVVPGSQSFIAVRLDEKAGHGTQGFLPIVAPHFGGLWQKVELIVVGPAWIDDTKIFIDATRFDADKAGSQSIDEANTHGSLCVGVELNGALPPEAQLRMTVSFNEKQLPGQVVAPVQDRKVRLEWKGSIVPWSPADPSLYRVDLELLGPDGALWDHVTRRIGFRKIETNGPTILLNNEPLTVRGYLTWGCAPPDPAPIFSKEAFRQELCYFRDCGFNLVKFCLWWPPSELLDIVDEEGMLAWIEYPTWHARIDKAHQQELLREYREMSSLDGAHPSVILRSVTCETGPSADLDVVRALYDLLKEQAPATLVEDDSSWIEWNRIHDFWDDHPYGNNSTWRAELAKLEAHRQEHGVKPLLLGEAVAADTWIDAKRFAKTSAGKKPWWTPGWFESQVAFEQNLKQRFSRPGYDPVQDLKETSLHYAMAQRRWQIGTFREVLPDSGYVVSVVRDVRLCAMGLLDCFGQPKWPAPAWSWHGHLTAPLKTPGDQRAFRAGPEGGFRFYPCLRAAGDRARALPSRIRWTGPNESVKEIALDPGIHKGFPLNLDLEEVFLPFPEPVDQPKEAQFQCQVFGDRDIIFESAWSLWALPELDAFSRRTVCYGALDDDEWIRLFQGAKSVRQGQPIAPKTPVVITPVLDDMILNYLEGGGRVLHLVSKRKGSFKAEGLWFLRGTIWAPPIPEAFFERVPKKMLETLQNFELSGNGVVRGERLWDQVDPLLAHLETHDLDRVRPNLLLFQTHVGRGRLLVSCLNHSGGAANNYAGLWLARALLRHLTKGPPPTRYLDNRLRSDFAASLNMKIFDLKTPWRFSKDEENNGLDQGWQRVEFDDSGWILLNARSAEERKIWNGFDGWGWYRQAIEIPASWSGKRVRLVLDSVDDMYELYINGKQAGGYGKLDRSESSYLKRTWVDVGPHLKAGRKNLFALRIHDWVGGGGLNGPAWLLAGQGDPEFDLLER